MSDHSITEVKCIGKGGCGADLFAIGQMTKRYQSLSVLVGLTHNGLQAASIFTQTLSL